MGGHGLASVVDEVLEAGAPRGVARQGDLDGLAVRADRELRPRAVGGAHRPDGQQPAGGGGVVVERVQDRGAAGPRPEVVLPGLRRPAVALVLPVVVVVLLLVLGLEVEGVPVVETGRLVGVDVPDATGLAVVEDDLAAVGAEDEAAGRGGEGLGCGRVAAARRHHRTGAAGPRAVDTVAQADGCRRVAGDLTGHGRHLAGGQVDRQQRVARSDQDRGRAGTGLLQDRARRHLGLGAADDEEPAAGRVEDDGHRTDGGERDGVADGVAGEVLGGGLEEPRVALLAQGQEPVLGRGGGQDGAVQRHGHGGVLAHLGERIGLVGQGRDARDAHLGVLARRPQVAGRGVQHGEAASGHPDDRAAGDRGLLAVGHLHLGGVQGHDDTVGQVDADDRVAVLDDVEVGVGTREDGAVELTDGLVDAAVRAVTLAGDPDAAVVQVGPVSLVAVGLDGVRDDAAHGDGEREPGHQRSASALQVLPERHAVSLHRSASSTALWKPTGRPMEPKQREDVEQSRARSRTVGSSWITMVTQWGLSRQRKGPIG